MSVEFSQLFDKVLFCIDESLLDEYGEEGIYNNLLKYVRWVSGDKITDKLFISEELITDEYTKNYLEKNEHQDFNAKDCAVCAI